MNEKNIFRFTDIGEGLHEGTIQEIKVKLGDNVKEGQPLLSVQTDKVASDLPSPQTGTILMIYVKEGLLIHVGDPMIYIGEPGEKLEPQTSTSSAAITTSNVMLTPEQVDEAILEKSASVVGEVKVSNKLMGKLGIQANANQSLISNNYYSVVATPLARKMANELRVNLSQINGSGPSGRIVYDDVILFQRNRLANELNNFNAQTSKDHQIAVTLKPDDCIHEISQTRKQISITMSNAHYNIADTTLVFQIDVTELVKFRNKIKDDFKKKHGVNITYLAFFIQAISLALKKYPLFNATYDPINQYLIYRNEINMGIAVDSKDGLLVPNMKNSNQLNLSQISQEIARLAKASRDKKLTLSEIQGGTYTITNLGSTGALYGQPIIFYPQLSIFGLGGIEKKLFLDKNNKVTQKDMMYITVTVDHKWIDGADVGRFANFIKEQIEFKFYERDWKNVK